MIKNCSGSAVSLKQGSQNDNFQTLKIFEKCLKTLETLQKGVFSEMPEQQCWGAVPFWPRSGSS